MAIQGASFLIWAGSFAIGLVGALTGLGGGAIIVPLLVLAFGIDIRYAAGASLVSVIATSSGAAAAYVREGVSNVRIGMFLEIATTVGALAGAALVGIVATHVIAVVFAAMLLLAAGSSLRGRGDDASPPPGADRIASALRLDGSYPEGGRQVAYGVLRVPAGFGVMFVAGTLSGLLGIGSGPMKVIAMDQVMRLPFKVSTATSNFMIGVTAAASAGVYLARGYVVPTLAAPVVLGILPGALLGSRLLPRVRSRSLRVVFAAVVALLAAQMFYRGVTGTI